MATIGLDRLYYAKITEGENGEETYATPTPLAKAISAELSVELAEAILYADDGAAEIVKEFKNGTLALGIDDIGSTVASDLTGATIDDNHVLISTSEDGGTPVAVGFRAKRPTANTSITGFTRESSVFPPPTLLPRVTASRSLRPPSKAPSCAVTSWMPRASIPGKQRSPRETRRLPLKPSPTGTRTSTNPALHLRKGGLTHG